MKRFDTFELREAVEHCRQGGQAIHMMPPHNTSGAPKCFQGRTFAHLIDHDEERLVATAKRLGVRIRKVERRGHVWQHIDLVGKPLERALEEANDEAKT